MIKDLKQLKKEQTARQKKDRLLLALEVATATILISLVLFLLT